MTPITLMPWVTVNVRYDDPAIRDVMRTVKVELEEAGRQAVETLARAGYKAAIVIEVGKDPR